MMDFENSCLQEWDASEGIPKGEGRWAIEEWASLTQNHVYPHHSDVNWAEYVTWVCGTVETIHGLEEILSVVAYL